MSNLITHINRDISAGETFRHKGGIMLHGSVGKDARVEIDDGCLKVVGDVDNGATLYTRGDGKLAGGITIKGKTGNDVTLDSDKAIKLADAGKRLRIRAGAGVSFGHVGEGMNLSAGAEVNGGNAGINAHIRCKASCVVAEVGDGSIIRAGTLMQVTFAGHDCRLSSDAFNAAAVGANSEVTANSDANIGIAHGSAHITAGVVRVRETAPDDKSFARKIGKPAV